MAPTPTWRSFIGVAKETTKGTAVAPTAYIPVRTCNPKRTPTRLDDVGWRGSAVDTYGSQQGKIVASHSIEGDVFVDTLGFWLKCLLGDESISGAGPYTHNFAPLNTGDQQPPALTITDQIGAIESRAWPGVQLSEVKLTIDVDGNITYSCSGMGFPEATASTPTPAFGTLKPLQGWLITANVNGAAAQLASLEMTISAPVNAIKTTSGTQNPFAVWRGVLGVAITANVVAESNSHLANLVSDAQGVFSFTGTRGAGATAETLTATCTTTAYEGVEISRSNDWVEYALTLKPVANATDVGASAGFSPVKLTLVNARSTVY
jgi:hypothetical protein